jgi:S1-C subfamily serine protease
MKTAENLSLEDDSKSNLSSGSSSKNSNKKFRIGCRRLSIIALIVILVTICCSSVLGFLWAGGYAQKGVCDAVLEGSEIYKNLDCANIGANLKEGEVEDPEAEFPVKVAEDKDTETSVPAGTFDVTKVYEKASPAIVGVGVKSNDVLADQVIGTGFVISSNGLVATNQHVVSVEDAEYFIKFEGDDELVDVTEIIRDPINDIAILRVDHGDLPALTLANSDNLKPGQPVVAIGNPLGTFSSTVTSGIISGLHREVNVDSGFLRTNVETFEDTIQTDAAINPGNSGGPLLNAQGHVVGINFATLAGADNLSFAIPINLLKVRIDELQEYGAFRIPYLGVQTRSRLVAVGQEVFVGAEVVAVDPDGGAAGKLKKEDVILSVDGENLEENTLFSLIQKTKIGDEVEMIVLRDGEKIMVKANIVERK